MLKIAFAHDSLAYRMSAPNAALERLVGQPLALLAKLRVAARLALSCGYIELQSRVLHVKEVNSEACSGRSSLSC